jgi:hypothetical protein
MTTPAEFKEIELLRARMIKENPTPDAIRLDIYQREVRANEDLDSVKVYAKLLFDKSVVYPRGIRDVIQAFRLTGHKEAAPLMTSDHVNAYREGMMLVSSEMHMEIYDGLSPRDTIRHQKALTLVYAISDAKTRTFVKEHPSQIARELWDSDITALPEVQRYLTQMMVTAEDSISKPISGGAL